MTRRRHDRALVWFRRDLRDFDHAALHHALAAARVVYCAFVFDREILDRLPSPQDRRVEFIWESVRELDAALRAKGGGLVVRHAAARSAIPRLAAELGVDAVYCNHDYEPAACDRDAAVAHDLARTGVAMCTFKDQVIFERDEILTGSGKPFSVFTPYRTAWLRTLTPGHVAAHEVAGIAGALAPPPAAVAGALPSLEAMGFARTNLAALPVQPGMSGGAATLADFRDRIDGYRDTRDFPALRGTSTLSVHLRFGTVSIRHLVGWAHACTRSSPSTTASPSSTTRNGSTRGAAGRPATRSSTRRCASSRPPAPCTTGCAWSRRASW